MALLVEWVLFIVAGVSSLATPVNLHVPGAQFARVHITRQITNDNAPMFTGRVFAVSDGGAFNVDCGWTPYWEGETRYPCWPQTTTLPADGVWTFRPVDDADGTLVMVVQVFGYPPAVFLPMVGR